MFIILQASYIIIFLVPCHLSCLYVLWIKACQPIIYLGLKVNVMSWYVIGSRNLDHPGLIRNNVLMPGFFDTEQLPTLGLALQQLLPFPRLASKTTVTLFHYDTGQPMGFDSRQVQVQLQLWPVPSQLSNDDSREKLLGLRRLDFRSRQRPAG